LPSLNAFIALLFEDTLRGLIVPSFIVKPEMITQEQVVKVVEEMLGGTDKFLVEVLIQPSNKITVFFDGDNSVSISDCQRLSRFIEERLDRDYTDYQLTVSSAGMDRPIKLLRQFKKRIGKELEIISSTGERISGVLVSADDKSIELEHPVKNPKKEVAKPNSVITTDKIKSAKIIITFGKLN
jgi:ribosome maturation factor RimP